MNSAENAPSKSFVNGVAEKASRQNKAGNVPQSIIDALLPNLEVDMPNDVRLKSIVMAWVQNKCVTENEARMFESLAYLIAEHAESKYA
jgi:hypothetical protein